MTLDVLKDRLFAEGYRLLVHELRPWGLMISDLHLTWIGGRFTVAWTERGEIVETLHAGEDETAACDCFHEVVSDRQWHFRTFMDGPEADAATARLQAAGLRVTRNDISNFNGAGDARHRLFLVGRDLAGAERIVAPDASAR